MAAFLAAVLGLVVGSHVATIAIRLPRRESAARGRSRCDGCSMPLQWWHLVPLASWLALRGRCAGCGEGIDPRHPLVEVASMLVAVAMACLLPLPAAVAGSALGLTLLLLVVLDLDHLWLPDRITLPLLGAGLAVAGVGIGPPFVDRVVGVGIGWGALAGVAWAYRRLRGRTGLGGGDAKLMGAIGAWVGWQALPIVLLGASAGGLAYVAARRVAGRPLGGTDRIPFGPFLAAAGLIAWTLVAA